MRNILVLNQISQLGLQRLPASHYRVGPDVSDPEAIVLRSMLPLPSRSQS